MLFYRPAFPHDTGKYRITYRIFELSLITQIMKGIIDSRVTSGKGSEREIQDDFFWRC